MYKLVINGGKQLNGSINISGAKNCAVALIPAALLSDETIKINNVPDISDIDALEEILTYLDAKIERNNDEVIIHSSMINNKP
ncbi:MAG: hypothetical protein IJ104_06830, partial [Methanobrevibacter sp.]|nr:hypothetical protein [Methanobrevibacter sp.]